MTRNYSRKSGGKKARSDTGNQKVKNVKPIYYDGIQFKSTLESTCYKECVKAGFNISYEPAHKEIFPAFTCNVPFYTKDGKNNLVLKSKKVQDIVYTIDFEINTKIGTFVCECKGKENDAFRNINKLYRFLIKDSDIKGHFKVHNKTQIMQMIEVIKQIINAESISK